ncbi:MAG TPA: RagB/SusD family nutrient uptake outer membrane protein, partial [Longimicrobiaceae bacterium]|nr:RagB/SusD family nutrient uptake outer membrane protein [Longimicrobiaceae bacterium]
MKKNAIRLAAGCLMLMVGVTGCTDLTEYNPGGLTSQTVFTTPEGFETLVNAAYSYTRWWYGKEEGIAMSEMGTDIWTSGAGDENPTLNTYEDLMATQDAIDSEWEHLYQALNLVNAGIAGIDKAGLSPALHDQRLAELRFLRAFYGWHIAETWGGPDAGVVFPTEPSKGIVTTATKTPVAEVYDTIFADLDYAVAHLSPTTDDYGRITKYGAEAFEARMYLTRGENQKALDAAKDVIDNGGYHLLDDYADLWRMDNLQNPEVIWAINYSTTKDLNDQRTDFYPGGHKRGGNDSHLFYLSIYDKSPGMVRDIAYGRPFNRYMPTEYLLDLYGPNDARYQDSFNEVWYSNDPKGGPGGMQPGDTAILMTRRVVPASESVGKNYQIFDRDSTYNADGTVRDNRHYPSLTKFLDPTRPSVSEQVSGRDVFVIRLAEMYLIAAEAE